MIPGDQHQPRGDVIHDCVVPLKTNYSSYMLWMIVPIIPMIITAKAFLPPQFHLFSLFAIMMMFPLIVEFLVARRACANLSFAERDSAARGGELLNNLTPILTRNAPPFAYNLLTVDFRRFHVSGVLAAILFRRGFSGTVVRLAKDASKLNDRLVPFAAPFEPIPLKQDHPALLSLRGDPIRPRGLVRRYYDIICEVQGSRRNAMILFYFFAANLTIATIMLIYLAFRGILVGTMPALFDELWPFVALAMVLPLWCLWRPQEWFIVPGAIVVRESSWHSSKWRLNLMPRENSVLVYWQDLRFLAVADATGRSFVRRATSIEAETAIRAWLSPLSPLERMDDLR